MIPGKGRPPSIWASPRKGDLGPFPRDRPPGTLGGNGGPGLEGPTVTNSKTLASRRTFLAAAGLSLAAAGCSATGQSSATTSPVVPTSVAPVDVASAGGSAGGAVTTSATPTPSDGGIATANVFTPVVATPVTQVAPPVPGSDGLIHVQYELQIVNGKNPLATLQALDVLAADDHSTVLRSYTQDQILAALRTVVPAPATDTTIPVGETRFLYVELSFPAQEKVPDAVVHRFTLLGAANPGPVEPTQMTYLITPVSLVAPPLLVLSPPLTGDGWLDINGAFNSDIVHRGSVQTVNGQFHFAQRYAIDFMRLNEAGQIIDGDAADVTANVAYGADILAVADGTVVAVLDELLDQPPGKLPDPTTITMDTVDGNHIVLDLGAGRYGFFAHLQRGSVLVKPGDTVAAGQVMAKLGNSGNSSGPHLHFHVMDGPSVLGSEGLPFVFTTFETAGAIDKAQFDATMDFVGDWSAGRAPAVPHTNSFPMDKQILNFA